MIATKQETSRMNRMNRFLNGIEWLGNLLPHPVALFLALIVIVLAVSAIGAHFDVSVLDPRPEGAKGRAADGVIRVVSLLNQQGVVRIIEHLVSNYTGFAPLGTAMVALLGVGIAEKSGLLSAAMRGIILKAPASMVTLAIVFAGVMSNVAMDVGYVVIIPLAGMVFYSLGRHPLAGVAAAFAGVSGGYSANLLLGSVDPILAGITQAAARLVAPDYRVGAEANWYFMVASTLVISLAGYWVTDKIIEPRLGAYRKDEGDAGIETLSIEQMSAAEKRGLKAAGFTLLALSALLTAAVLPEHAWLRNAKTGAIAHSPFMNGIIAFVFVFFALAGIAYGRFAGSMKTSQDIVGGMVSSMQAMAVYLVLMFFVSQFTAYFNWSNLGPILAVKGSEFLKAAGWEGGLLMLGFIVVCALLNLMIASSSGLWAVTAPVFVPMLMLSGYSPEVVQAAYRIGDSVSNIVTPLMGYFGFILAVAMRYKKDTGVGTLVSMMLPYSVVFLLAWSALFYLWVFVLGWPVGPGAATFYSP